MRVRFAPLLLAAGTLLVFAGCSSDKTYNTSKGDDQYDLEAMLLRNADLPVGMVEQQTLGFDNQDWAQTTSDDPEKQATILDQQQRIRNQVAVYARQDSSQLGRVFRVTSQSTLYKDGTSAAAALTNPMAACGTQPPAAKEIAEDFAVPKIGEQSIGFILSRDNARDPDTGQQSPKFVETTVCFRTGRIVHAVTQLALDGAEDVQFSVRLAQRMLVRVENTLDGKPDPKEKPVKASPG
jgi:hypothetical protein